MNVNDHTRIEVRVTCLFCERETLIEVNREKYRRWQDGELIQNVFPEMSAEEREMLISGTHPRCWDENMGGGD